LSSNVSPQAPSVRPCVLLVSNSTQPDRAGLRHHGSNPMMRLVTPLDPRSASRAFACSSKRRRDDARSSWGTRVTSDLSVDVLIGPIHDLPRSLLIVDRQPVHRGLNIGIVVVVVQARGSGVYPSGGRRMSREPVRAGRFLRMSLWQRTSLRRSGESASGL
jgi:hypothetical protein